MTVIVMISPSSFLYMLLRYPPAVYYINWAFLLVVQVWPQKAYEGM